MASRNHLQRLYPRRACCLGRGEKLGCLAAVPLLGALWRERPISFYLFTLPAYIAIKNWMLLTLFLSALFAGAIYWVHGDIEYVAQRRSMSPTAIAHGSALLGLFFAVKAWSYDLDRYLLLYGDNGVVVGASYTDVHVELPVLWLLVGLSIIAALTAWTNVKMRTFRIPVAAAVLVFGGSFVLSGVQHRANPAGLQPRSDHSKTVPRRTGPHLQDTRSQ